MPQVLPSTFDKAYDDAGADGTAGNYDGPKLERVEPGAYLFVCVGYENRKGGDKDILRLFCRVESGVENQATGQEDKITAYDLFLTDKAVWKLAGSMKCLNITCSDRQVFHPEAFVGRKFAGDVQENTYTKRGGEPGVITNVASIAPPIDTSVNEPMRDASDPEIVQIARDFVENADLPF